MERRQVWGNRRCNFSSGFSFPTTLNSAAVYEKEERNWSQDWNHPHRFMKAPQEVCVNKGSNGAYFSIFKSVLILKTISNISHLKVRTLRLPEGTASKNRWSNEHTLSWPRAQVGYNSANHWNPDHLGWFSLWHNFNSFKSLYIFKYVIAVLLNLLLYLIASRLFWREKVESILKLKYNKVMWGKIMKEICKSIFRCLLTDL